MKKSIKRCLAGVLAGTMLFAQSIPAMAETETPKVFVNFICAGQITGQLVPAGSNVTAPAAPYRPGYTFCGFDKSLNNVTANTTYTAVYVSNDLGEGVINATKASLPAPAVTATTVAAPAANVVLPAAQTTQAPAAQNQNVAATQTAQTATTQDQTAAAAQAAQLAQAQALFAQLQAIAQAQKAAQTQDTAAQATATAQTQNTATQTTAPAQTQDTTVQAAPVSNIAAAATAIQAAIPAGVPSWVVGLEGVDAAGAANAYNYLKNTKGLDDASIQANWGAFMHHYAGHGVAGW